MTASAPSPPVESRSEAAARQAMVERQLRRRDIVDARVLAAMGSVPRALFVPAAQRAAAYDDGALPIGRGQTISQPYVVALMTQLLGLAGHERVLEIGSGSGYQAAVLSRLAREVFSVELDAALAAQARATLAALGCDNVQIRDGDGCFGWPEAAPFDAMIVTAAAPGFPDALLAQLSPEGRVVAPLERDDGEALALGVRRGAAIDWSWHGAVRFVPMTGAVRQSRRSTR